MTDISPSRESGYEQPKGLPEGWTICEDPSAAKLVGGIATALYQRVYGDDTQLLQGPNSPRTISASVPEHASA